MSGLIPPGKNAAERTAYLKNLYGGLPDGQASLFGDDSEEVRENRKLKKQQKKAGEAAGEHSSRKGVSERMIDGNCTKERPGKEYRYHPDAKEVGEQEDGYPGGDIVTYECPHCGARWKEELPQ